MSKPDDDGGTARLIPRGSCTWCGHKPHPEPCESHIRTGKSTSRPCGCPRPPGPLNPDRPPHPEENPTP